MQADAAAVPQIAADSFDIVASDAVLEHVTDLPRMMSEMHRLLRPGGFLWATYGPLWHSFGGDHVSGYDSLVNGYNHLLLDPEEYEKYLDGLGEFSHDEKDGRTWWRNGLFSFLKIEDYDRIITEAGFEWRYFGLVIDPRALKWLRQNPERSNLLLQKVRMLDLVCSGIWTVASKV